MTQTTSIYAKLSGIFQCYQSRYLGMTIYLVSCSHTRNIPTSPIFLKWRLSFAPPLPPPPRWCPWGDPLSGFGWPLPWVAGRVSMLGKENLIREMIIFATQIESVPSNKKKVASNIEKSDGSKKVSWTQLGFHWDFIL